MKKHLIPLLLLGLLLFSGCAAQNPQTESEEFSPAVSVVSAEAAVKASLIPEATETNGLLSCHLQEPLHGFLSMGQNLLLFSGKETTVLEVLNTETMEISAVHTPGYLLMPENATVQRMNTGISYFNGAGMETVVLDEHLREIRRIAAPEDLSGFPLLSSDGKTLFYCTPDSIRALDLNSGISRILKEAAYPVQGLSGLLLEDSVLQVSITDASGQWQTLFLSSETGQLLKECSGNLLPETSENAYFLQGQLEGIDTILFGQATGDVRTLQPLRRSTGGFFLPDTNRAVTFSAENGSSCLDLYDLHTERRMAELILPGDHFLKIAAETSDGTIWFLCEGEPVLYQWNPAVSTVRDTEDYASIYYTRENPDYDGLAACSLHAQELSEKHGIDILIYKEAASTEPWDYHLEYEYRADLLQQELNALDQRLCRFPAGFLQTLAGKFTDLNICIVRSAQGSPESGSPEAVNGIQFLVDFDAYIVLATDHDTEYALYHELSHLMETAVLTESTAYDRWDNLNPEGFRYDNDYIINADRDGSTWLKPGAEYFIDTYAMSYAKEDRARLFEYAMTTGHEDLFTSPNLQRKLRQMCTGIREAFRLENETESLPWEQYLDQ